MTTQYTTDEILDRLETLVEAAREVRTNWESGDLAVANAQLQISRRDAEQLLNDMGRRQPAEEEHAAAEPPPLPWR